jgi:hypothetical protein
MTSVHSPEVAVEPHDDTPDRAQDVVVGPARSTARAIAHRRGLLEGIILAWTIALLVVLLADVL